MKKENNNKKEDKLIYITHKGELLIWLIITLIFLFAFILFIRIKDNNDNEYTIFMPDVDGLIVGSPVRAMGIEIGHVTKIKPTNDEVFVKFLINNKDIDLPQGTIATTEFSGMAGSKSLELYLPDENDYIDSSVQLLVVDPPKRLNDAFGLLNEMFKKLNAIIDTTSIFVEKIDDIDFPKSNKNIDLNTKLNEYDNLLDSYTKQAVEFNNKLNKFNKK